MTTAREIAQQIIDAEDGLLEAYPMMKCQRCAGKGHHHGFGEDGHDPDWCDHCGGQGEVGDDQEYFARRRAVVESALLAERRRAIETCQRIADEKAQACTALADACVVGASGPYSRTERTILDKRWHTAQASAFREAAHAIGSLASPREET